MQYHESSIFANILYYESSIFAGKTTKDFFVESEKAIIRSSIKGLSSVEIAETNGTSETTVKTQKRIMFKKLGVKSMSEAIRVAMNNGML